MNTYLSNFFYKFRIVYLNIIFSLLFYISANSQNMFQYCFLDLPDGIIKNEIGVFYKSESKLSNSLNLNLIEFPIVSCDSTIVVFNFKNTYIQLYYLNQQDNLKNHQEKNEISFNKNGIIKEILIIFHSHCCYEIPTSEYIDIIPSCECNLNKKNRKSEKQYLDCMKVFRSIDKQRLYIYIISGLDQKKYQNVLIIDNGKYIGKVIDKY